MYARRHTRGFHEDENRQGTRDQGARCVLPEKLSVEAVEPIAMGPDEFAQFIKTDIARWTRLARERNIQLES